VASIAFSEVSKVFPDGTAAVDGLDLEIPDGGFTVLVGPSGSGKSTALRMVAGLEEATAGTIRIADRVVNDVAPKDRDIAMVFQSYALYPHMSVQDNLGFALKMHSVEKTRARDRVGAVARRLGIGEQLPRRPRQLSGGQRQRVALGRAIVREPQAFLMDEPLSNLDAKLRVEMRAYIARLHQELGTTTLYVTHDQTEAMTMGDRVAVMRDGRLEQVDAPQALYDRPANLFVAAFIGSPAMNLLRGRLVLHEGRVQAQLGGERLVLPDELLDARPVLSGWVDGDVVFGIRPEAVTVVDADTPAGSVLALEVLLVEALGSDLLVHLQTDAPRVTMSDAFDGEDEAGLEARFTARLEPHVRVDVGDRLRLGVDLERLHVFDPDTGLALR
jgi:multiple sugar transport system ATP-binding protein